MIGILQEIDQCRGYQELGYASLFQYATQSLKLSRDVSYTFITLARKSKAVPALKTKIDSGEISVSNARVIAAVLTPENQDNLLPKAESLPKRALEEAVAQEFPHRAVKETTKFVAPQRIELKLGIYPELEKKLKRAQDLVSRSQRKAATLEQTLETLVGEFLKRQDPLEKAKRAEVRKAPASSEPSVSSESSTRPGASLNQRKPLPAALKHQVLRRDQDRCTRRLPSGERCPETRWIDVHHRIEVQEGGKDTLENLETLCQAHHRAHHRTCASQESSRSREQHAKEQKAKEQKAKELYWSTPSIFH